MLSCRAAEIFKYAALVVNKAISEIRRFKTDEAKLSEFSLLSGSYVHSTNSNIGLRIDLRIFFLFSSSLTF